MWYDWKLTNVNQSHTISSSALQAQNINSSQVISSTQKKTNKKNSLKTQDWATHPSYPSPSLNLLFSSFNGCFVCKSASTSFMQDSLSNSQWKSQRAGDLAEPPPCCLNLLCLRRCWESQKVFMFPIPIAFKSLLKRKLACQVLFIGDLIMSQRYIKERRLRRMSTKSKQTFLVFVEVLLSSFIMW